MSNVLLSSSSLSPAWVFYKRFVLDNPWVPKRRDPVSGLLGPSVKQADFLCRSELEVFYGGSAGGGKTEALLTAFAMFVGYSHYNGVLFRKSLQDHKKPKGLIDRCHEWWDSLVVNGRKARWNGVDFTWSFPSGATLIFGYMDSDDDKYRYKSSEFDFIGWDELTEFTEDQYTYLMSRLRRGANSVIPPRVRSASNPDGIGHDWVKARFIKGDGLKGVFIPARLDDNNFIDRAGYEASLGMLDYVTRMQLRFGDWDIAAQGNKFKYVWFINSDVKLGATRNQIVDAVPNGLKTVRFWDLAATEPKKGSDPDWTVGVKMGYDHGRFYVPDMQRFRGSPKENERRIKETAVRDGLGVTQYFEQEPGSNAKSFIEHYIVDVLVGLPCKGERATGDKELRANPFSTACENGLVYLLRAGWNMDFINELCQFPKGSHDDIIDSASGAYLKVCNTDVAPIWKALA